MAKFIKTQKEGGLSITLNTDQIVMFEKKNQGCFVLTSDGKEIELPMLSYERLQQIVGAVLD